MSEPGLDRLYAVPLGAFTATRNEIAAALAASGDAEGAAAVKALKKPSIVAWTVNQLVRRHPGSIDRLLEAGDSLRKAHRKALSAAGSAGLREASLVEREALAGLLANVEPIMSEAGSNTSRAHLQAIEDTLSAAAVDDAARELLKAGRLTAEMHRAGFGDVQGLTVIQGEGRAAPDEGAEERERSRELEREARFAEREAERLANIAETATSKRDRLREKIGEAEAEAAAAEAAAGAARKAASRARTAADDAAKR